MVEIGFPGKPKKYVPFPSVGTGARTFPEHDRSSGLDLGSGEEELGVQFCQRLFDQIVASHGDPTGQKKQI